jgi:hypothetical protein
MDARRISIASPAAAPSMRVMRMVLLAVPTLALVSCAGYVRHHDPVAIQRKGDRCDYTYEVKTKRGNGDLVHRGLESTTRRTGKPYRVEIVNHGVEFEVTLHSWRDRDRDWAAIASGQSETFDLGPKDTGFQFSNESRVRLERATPVRATIIFKNLPADLEDKRLLEAGGGL